MFLSSYPFLQNDSVVNNTYIIYFSYNNNNIMYVQFYITIIHLEDNQVCS